MTRTKLADRVLPTYTKGEEIFNMVTHIVGAAMGVTALVLCIVKAALTHNGFGLAGGIVYGISMIILFTMSSIYHGLSPRLDKAKKVFQILDHCTIFVLIAGTYTPILLCSIMKVSTVTAWVLFGIIWAVSILGITLNAIDIKKYEKFSMACYLIMGWCIIFKFNLILKTIATPGIVLLVLGGICYTIGTLFYGGEKNHRYMHSIWHIWILFGALAHFLCIYLYVI